MRSAAVAMLATWRLAIGDHPGSVSSNEVPIAIVDSGLRRSCETIASTSSRAATARRARVVACRSAAYCAASRRIHIKARPPLSAMPSNVATVTTTCISSATSWAWVDSCSNAACSRPTNSAITCSRSSRAGATVLSKNGNTVRESPDFVRCSVASVATVT